MCLGPLPGEGQLRELFINSESAIRADGSATGRGVWLKNRAVRKLAKIFESVAADDRGSKAIQFW